MDPAVLILGSLAGLAAFLTALRETVKWFSERKSNEIGTAVGQLGSILDQVRSENERLVVLNEKQREQIDKLEEENHKLEILVRSLTTQNMEVAHEGQRAQSRLEDLMKEHHELLGRLKQQGGFDAA